MDGQSAISRILGGFCDVSPCSGHGALLVDDARSERTSFMFDAAQAQARTRTRKSGEESLICLFPSLSDSVNAHSSTPPESVAACEHRYARDILGSLELHLPALGKRPMLVFPALCQAWFIATSQYPHPRQERVGELAGGKVRESGWGP